MTYEYYKRMITLCRLTGGKPKGHFRIIYDLIKNNFSDLIFFTCEDNYGAFIFWGKSPESIMCEYAINNNNLYVNKVVIWDTLLKINMTDEEISSFLRSYFSEVDLFNWKGIPIRNIYPGNLHSIEYECEVLSIDDLKWNKDAL